MSAHELHSTRGVNILPVSAPLTQHQGGVYEECPYFPISLLLQVQRIITVIWVSAAILATGPLIGWNSYVAEVKINKALKMVKGFSKLILAAL